ncbi:MAG: ferredoxin reductase, partial [Kiloniellales bacterium]
MTKPGPKTLRDVRVNDVSREAEDIVSFELVDPDGGDLAPFAAGAHIDVHIDDGLVRQFSLCNDPDERHRYVIAVLKEPDGRGGSQALHDTVRSGDLLSVSEPRNYFPLAGDAAHHLLLAGGIGVTPMMAMVEALEVKGADYFLHYCARAPENTAFLDRLRPLVDAGRVALHHDGGDPRRGLDIDATLKNPEPGTHLYYCGPPGFMSAAASAVVHWP